MLISDWLTVFLCSVCSMWSGTDLTDLNTKLTEHQPSLSWDSSWLWSPQSWWGMLDSDWLKIWNTHFWLVDRFLWMFFWSPSWRMLMGPGNLGLKILMSGNWFILLLIGWYNNSWLVVRDSVKDSILYTYYFCYSVIFFFSFLVIPSNYFYHGLDTGTGQYSDEDSDILASQERNLKSKIGQINSKNLSQILTSGSGLEEDDVEPSFTEKVCHSLKYTLLSIFIFR